MIIELTQKEFVKQRVFMLATILVQRRQHQSRVDIVMDDVGLETVLSITL
jgi:hypothetical protein